MSSFGIDIPGLGGFSFSDSSGDSVASKNYKRKRKHAIYDYEHRIQRTAEDAKAAGLSPLAALGAAGQSMPDIELTRGSGSNVSADLQLSQAALIEDQKNADFQREVDLMIIGHLLRQREGGLAGQPVPQASGVKATPDFVEIDGQKYPRPIGEEVSRWRGELFGELDAIYKNFQSAWDHLNEISAIKDSEMELSPATKRRLRKMKWKELQPDLRSPK
jgi:hypothetical protein